MAELTGTVNVPAVGKVPKKEAVIGAVVVVTLIIVYYVRKKNTTAAAATTAATAATATDQYPPDGTTGNPQDPYSTDPATNQTYGNEAAGSGGTYGAYGSGAASGQYYDPATGAYDLSSPYGTSPVTQPYQTTGGPPFSSNSAWSDWVIQELQTLNPGIDAGALTSALGLYLDGQPVTAAEKSLILEATGIGGNPPVAGPGNYPPNVRLNGGKGGTTLVTVPRVTGDSREDAESALSSAGFKYVTKPARTTPGKGYTVTGQSPAAGTKADEGSTVTLTIRVTGGGTKPPADKTVAVPHVVGMSGEAAKSALSRAGFRKVDQVPASTPRGKTTTVDSQRPAAGVKADPDTQAVTIHLKVG